MKNQNIPIPKAESSSFDVLIILYFHETFSFDETAFL